MPPSSAVTCTTICAWVKVNQTKTVNCTELKGVWGARRVSINDLTFKSA